MTEGKRKEGEPLIVRGKRDLPVLPGKSVTCSGFPEKDKYKKRYFRRLAGCLLR